MAIPRAKTGPVTGRSERPSASSPETRKADATQSPIHLARQALSRQHAAERLLLASELRALLSAVDGQVTPVLEQERAVACDAISRRYAELLHHLTHLPKEQRAAARERLMREKADELACVTRDIRGKADEVRRRATAALRDRYKLHRAAMLTRQRHERASFSVALPLRGMPCKGRLTLRRAKVTAVIASAMRRRHRRAPRPPGGT